MNEECEEKEREGGRSEGSEEGERRGDRARGRAVEGEGASERSRSRRFTPTLVSGFVCPGGHEALPAGRAGTLHSPARGIWLPILDEESVQEARGRARSGLVAVIEIFNTFGLSRPPFVRAVVFFFVRKTDRTR